MRRCPALVEAAQSAGAALADSDAQLGALRNFSLKNKKIHLFLFSVVLGFFSCGELGLLFDVVLRL